MPGNICFGCGKDNHHGLQIKSYWDGDKAICKWDSEDKYQGWNNVLYGGILASLIDCHTMCTAMAHAFKMEDREFMTEPIYKYATGTLTIKYLKPTPNDQPVELQAQVVEQKGKKSTIVCEVYSGDVKTAEATVIAIRVVDSSQGGSTVFT